MAQAWLMLQPPPLTPRCPRGQHHLYFFCCIRRPGLLPGGPEQRKGMGHWGRGAPAPRNTCCLACSLRQCALPACTHTYTHRTPSLLWPLPSPSHHTWEVNLLPWPLSMPPSPCSPEHHTAGTTPNLGPPAGGCTWPCRMDRWHPGLGITQPTLVLQMSIWRPRAGHWEPCLHPSLPQSHRPSAASGVDLPAEG